MDFFEIFLYLCLVAYIRRFVKYLVCKTIRQILLLYVMIRIIMGIFISHSMSELFRRSVMCILKMCRNRWCLRLFTTRMASEIALYAALLFGAHAIYVTACDSMICASGIPTRSTAAAADEATTIAIGSAFPISSDASIMILRAINFTSSPAYNILAR